MTAPARLWYGYVRLNGGLWELVCQDADWAACWEALYALKRPGRTVEKLVSWRDPELVERR